MSSLAELAVWPEEDVVAAEPNHLDWLEGRRSTSCAKSPDSARTPPSSSPGGKDSLVLLRLAEKAFRPGPFPFPLLHIDTGPQFSGSDRLPRPPCRATRRAPDRALGRGFDRRGSRCAPRSRGKPQPASIGHTARRDRGVWIRCADRRRTPRRGKGPRQRADLLVPRCLRPVGSEKPAPRAVESLQRARSQGRARARVSDQQLDRARRLAIHRA